MLNPEIMKEVLWGSMDLDTLDLAESQTIADKPADEATYKEIRNWMTIRHERNNAREATGKAAKRNPNDMDVSKLGQANVKEGDEQENEDCRQCNESQNDENSIDAFGKGGKGGKGGPMKCYNCNGEGHPQRLCPTKNPAATHDCHNCKGKGHYKSECTSAGGGAHQPYTPKGYGKGDFGK